MKTPKDLRTIVEEAAAGDPEAWEWIVGQYSDPLRKRLKIGERHRFHYRMNPDDLLQETFLAAWLGIGRFKWRGERSFWIWLKGIALNVLRNHVRFLISCKRKPYRTQPAGIPRLSTPIPGHT